MARTTGVLFLESTLEQGGAETALYDLATRLDPGRFRPVVCCLYAPGPVGERLMGRGVRVHHGLMKSRRDVAGGWRLLRLIRREKIDVVYLINQPLTLCWGALCARLAGVPVVSAVHCTYVSKGAPKLFVYRLLLPRVERIVAVAAEQKRHLVTVEGLPAEGIEVIHNGVDIERFGRAGDRAAARAALGIEDGRPVVGAVARLEPRKGIDVLIRAAVLVRRSMPEACFVVLGDGPDRGLLASLTRRLGLEGRVRLMGMRDDVADLLPAFDVCALPSRTEALPLALLEYLAAGKPVAATRVGSVGEVVVDGAHGLLVAPEDPEALAAALVRLLGDPALSGSLAAAGRRRVESAFSVEVMVKRTERLLAGLCGVGRS
jgi:glycosyltransferase involved in cell wall biosynthesis